MESEKQNPSAGLIEQINSLREEMRGENRQNRDFQEKMIGQLLKMNGQIENLQAEMNGLKGTVNGLSENFGRMERRVNAFEFAPSRPESPRMFRGGVGIHSVAGATAGVRRYSR